MKVVRYVSMKKAKPLITTKVSPRTLRLVRLIAQRTGERQYRILERLVEAEHDKPKENDNAGR